MLNLNYLFDLKDNFVNNWHKLECSQISKFLRVTMIWNSSPDKNNLVGQILYKISKLFFHHFCFPKSFIFFAGTIHFLPLFSIIFQILFSLVLFFENVPFHCRTMWTLRLVFLGAFFVSPLRPNTVLVFPNENQLRRSNRFHKLKKLSKMPKSSELKKAPISSLRSLCTRKPVDLPSQRKITGRYWKVFFK